MLRSIIRTLSSLILQLLAQPMTCQMLIPSAANACATAGWIMISGLFAGVGVSALQPHFASLFQVFEEVFPAGAKPRSLGVCFGAPDSSGAKNCPQHELEATSAAATALLPQFWRFPFPAPMLLLFGLRLDGSGSRPRDNTRRTASSNRPAVTYEASESITRRAPGRRWRIASKTAPNAEESFIKFCGRTNRDLPSSRSSTGGSCNHFS